MGFNWGRYSGSFVKFNEIGDKIRGEIVDIQEGRDFNGNPAPMLVIHTDEGERRWTVGQAYPQRRLAEIQPQIGWEIEACYEGDTEGRPGQNPAKRIEIKVIHEGRKVATGDDL
jgi:hypothetical protein